MHTEVPAAVLVADFPFGVPQNALAPHHLPPNSVILHHQKSSVFCAADSYHPGWAVDVWLKRDGVDTRTGACLTPDPESMALDSLDLGMNAESTAVQFQLSAQYDHDATASSAESMPVECTVLYSVECERNGVAVGDDHWQAADSIMSAASVGVKPNLLFENAAPGGRGVVVGASAAAVVSIDPQSRGHDHDHDQSRHPPKVSQTPPPATFGV